jgi:hypothetical protein
MDQKNSHISCGGVSLTTGALLTLPLPVLGLFKVEVFMPISQKNARKAGTVPASVAMTGQIQ